jgi:hypothetical protein
MFSLILLVFAKTVKLLWNKKLFCNKGILKNLETSTIKNKQKFIFKKSPEKKFSKEN